LVDTFFWGENFLFYEENNPTVFLPFLFIKYSKTTYKKHHLHVNIHGGKSLRALSGETAHL
jgi:hypothetical protein